MVIYALILAKKDSKRLTSKNSLDLCGKPMFLWNVEKCLEIFKKTFVSSDSNEILKIAKDAGAIPIKRPAELCGDTPNIPCYQHAIKEMKCDAIVAVQANSPTIRPGVIRQAKDLIEAGNDEIMTYYGNFEPYGSVWAIIADKLENYKDPYNPEPESWIFDNSIDIHTQQDFNKAETWLIHQL